MERWVTKEERKVMTKKQGDHASRSAREKTDREILELGGRDVQTGRDELRATGKRSQGA